MRVFLRLISALSIFWVAEASLAHAELAHILAAGSLVAPLKEAIKASGIDAAQLAEPTFGPAGGLRQRIEKGEAADLYLSANMEHPKALAEKNLQTLVVPFARNNLCLIGRQSLGLTADNALDKMLDPKVRLATSTPVVDPGGDYAMAVFKRAETVLAGAEAKLTEKSLKLIGGPTAMTPIAGHTPSASIFLADKADLLLYYCSGQEQTMQDVPDLVTVRLPPRIDVVATYGLALLSENPAAQRLALFLLSLQGQSILVKHGLVSAFAATP